MEGNAGRSEAAKGEQSLKLAVAISLLRSKLLQNPRHQPHPSSDSDALRWKQKAKDRKREILQLREDLKQAEEDASHCDLFPASASCKCYFFDNLGKLSPKQIEDSSNRRYNDVLRRRFLRQVRLKERRKTRFSASEDEGDQLRTAVDFLVDICDTSSPVEDAHFANWSHQAVDFISVSLQNLLSIGKNELIEGIVNSLIMRLVRRMCSPPSEDDSHHNKTGAQFYIQHLIRKLGSESYIGQRVLLAISERISVLAENLLFLDPFDNAFPIMHQCLFIMIQLIEFLVSDYLSTWTKSECFDKVLFEEWVTSILHARKGLELLENTNGLYVLYMDRITGQLAKQVSQVSMLQKLNQDILENLFH